MIVNILLILLFGLLLFIIYIMRKILIFIQERIDNEPSDEIKEQMREVDENFENYI